ncbi:MAG: hypothetical protein AAFO57_06425 [Pseudomonadota bacterium]
MVDLFDWDTSDYSPDYNDFNGFENFSYNNMDFFGFEDDEEDEERVLPPVIVTAPLVVSSGLIGLPLIGLLAPALPFGEPIDIAPEDIFPELTPCLEGLFEYFNAADFPDGVDMPALRDLVASVADEMFNASRNSVPNVPNAFVEYAAFAVQYADGSLGLSNTFTDLNSDDVNLTGPDASQFLSSLGAGDTIVGIIHTQNNSGLASPADATAFSRLAAALDRAGLPVNVALDGVNYIVGPDGEVRELAAGTYDGSSSDTEGPRIDENGNLQCGGSN